ncbi:SUN family RNA methylase [Cryptosporidium ryanae]|uniref:SUN family RNA methylase n=1 Tax=Cryptosporidium ryanae TaxID=515981 RepID=UPI00351A8965|nr:SUN family RNA methylase [Cryptosporidium ryanae]
MEEMGEIGTLGSDTKRFKTDEIGNLCVCRGELREILRSERQDEKKGKAEDGNCEYKSDTEKRGSRVSEKVSELEAGGVTIFEWYYRNQGICSSESEYKELFESIGRSLPISFRANRSHQQGELLSYILENFISEVNGEEGVLDLVRFGRNKLSEDCLSYSIYDITRDEMKKERSCHKLREFIKSQDIFGTISSQECVSMLPSIVLDINSADHRVLDLCSAPGSKSMHILDNMNFNSRNGDACLGIRMCEGVVLMNDVCMKRIDTLLTRINRMPSPSAIVTCIDATFMPKFVNKWSKKCFMFDRILADVPCSSDGTARKNSDILKNWRLEKAIHLHKKQLSILTRAYKLLDERGKLVYSTCSLNPIENEAVVSAFLQKYEDAVLIPPDEIIDKDFNLSLGLDSWLVHCSPNCNALNESTCTSAQNRNCCNSYKYISASMFPSKEWREKRYYEKCARALPHKNNTGGFFFAVISKNPTNKDTKYNTNLNSISEENPSCKYEEVDNSVWTDISNFFGLNNSTAFDCLNEFPEEVKSFFVNRSNYINSVTLSKSNLIFKKGSKKNMYLINSGVSRLLSNHNICINTKSVGIKCFEHFKGSISGNPNFNWRITQSSAPYIIRFMSKRLLFASLDILDYIEDNNIKGENSKKLTNDSKVIGMSSLCGNNEGVEGGCIVIVIVPPNILRYNGTSVVNPKFNKLSQSIILSAVLYPDSGISIFAPRSHISSIKQLVFA